jgi:hypothetical protein
MISWRELQVLRLGPAEVKVKVKDVLSNLQEGD